MEEKKVRLEQAITIKNAQEKNLLTKADIERYICDAVKLTAKQMIELLVERIDVYADKICIKLRCSDTPIKPPTDFSDTAQTDTLQEFSDAAANNADLCDIKSSQMEMRTYNHNNSENPDRNNSCRGFLLFSFTKAHEISQTRTYKSSRSRVFTYTTTFMLEIYI